MRVIERLPHVLLAIAAALPQAGCGDAARERDAEPEPPLEALRGVPVYPLSVAVTQAGSADALETGFQVAAAPDSVASWYRRELLAAGWRLVGDVRTPDGAVTLHAQRVGPPLWIIIQQSGAGEGTEYRLIGALPDGNDQR